MLWTHVTTSCRSSPGATSSTLPVPCTFDFNVAATKYFYGLADGEVPLSFLFSGTAFYESAGAHAAGRARSPWDKEATFRLPVETWHALMEHYYPNGAWLRLRLDTFERLSEYKRRHGIPTWEEALERLLPLVDAGGAIVSGDRGRCRSRAPCSTRATCCTRIARPRSRTASASPSASSYPHDYALDKEGSDRTRIQVECPVQGTAETRLEITRPVPAAGGAIDRGRRRPVARRCRA